MLIAPLTDRRLTEADARSLTVALAPWGLVVLVAHNSHALAVNHADGTSADDAPVGAFVALGRALERLDAEAEVARLCRLLERVREVVGG